jgi:glutaredoxin 3
VEVRVFSTPVCPFCNMVKDFLNEHNIPFKGVDVTKDHDAANEMIEKSGQMGVPVTIITDDKGSETIIVGFDKKKLKKTLEIED